MKKIAIFVAFLISLLGCDMFTTDETFLVGNIYLINPHNQDVNSYKMIITENDINRHIVEDNIIEVVGNDSVLIAKCKNNDSILVYYKIYHHKGYRPLNVINLSQKQYSILKKSIEIKYKFSDPDNVSN